jgi:outer membrane protein TolC
MLLIKLRFLAGVFLIAVTVAAGATFSMHVLRATPTTGQADSQPPDGAGKAPRVRALLKDKLATMREIVAWIEKSHQVGRASDEEVLQAKLAVLQAELELAESDRERVTVLEKVVAVQKEIETIVQTHFKAARAGQIDVLRAKANRLDAEIALERAKAKAAGK